jgi:PIN domain nuclease of toxin-antitoxin system
MRLLLDTQVLLWWVADDPALSKPARKLIAKGPEVFASAASAWEIAIKRGAGEAGRAGGFARGAGGGGIQRLPIDFEHAAVAGALPGHHDDPFDRMLVAQAQREGLTLLSSDARISPYAVTVLPAS